MNGLVSSGSRKVFPSMLKLMPCGEARSPAPTSAPIKECVVDIGKLRYVASSTVAAAAKATDRPKFGAVIACHSLRV